MFSTNPFSELSALISADIMQGYIILMFILVVLGTVLDMMHKKSAKYFFENAEKQKKAAKRTVSGGEKVGMLRIKMFRPFPVDAVRVVCAGAKKVGVLDRNCTADRGGIFWQEICAVMQGQGHPLIQGYLTGVGGSDVIPKTVHEVADDLAERTEAGEPVWKGL